MAHERDPKWQQDADALTFSADLASCMLPPSDPMALPAAASPLRKLRDAAQAMHNAADAAPPVATCQQRPCKEMSLTTPQVEKGRASMWPAKRSRCNKPWSNSMPHESHPRRVRPCATMALLVAAMLAACGTSAGDTPGAASAAASEPYRGYTLTLIGMNYTRRYIDTFTVDGRGGGNLHVSTPTAGGGKSACCIGWDNRRTLPVTMTVRWQFGACKVLTGRVTEDGRPTFNLHSGFKERKVTFDGPVPANPQYFVVHIFEDDHVEVSMSEDYPPPKLKLSQDREDLTPYPVCKDGQYGS